MFTSEPTGAISPISTLIFLCLPSSTHSAFQHPLTPLKLIIIMKFVTTAFTALAVSLAIARVDAFVRLSPENDPDGSRHLTEEPHDHSTKNVRRTSYFPKAKVPKKAAKGMFATANFVDDVVDGWHLTIVCGLLRQA